MPMYSDHEAEGYLRFLLTQSSGKTLRDIVGFLTDTGNINLFRKAIDGAMQSEGNTDQARLDWFCGELEKTHTLSGGTTSERARILAQRLFELDDISDKLPNEIAKEVDGSRLLIVFTVNNILCREGFSVTDTFSNFRLNRNGIVDAPRVLSKYLLEDIKKYGGAEKRYPQSHPAIMGILDEIQKQRSPMYAVTMNEEENGFTVDMSGPHAKFLIRNRNGKFGEIGLNGLVIDLDDLEA